jgi:4-carboxymuconolactone decarboxylase
MKISAPIFVLIAALAATPTDAQTMTITRSGSRAVQQGPAANFTGTVRVTPLFDATDGMRSAGASVTFEPGAHSAWHTHPRGQLLIVTAGAGRVQQWGGSVEEIRPGDVIWSPPGVKHWHGATATNSMSHIAITNMVGGKNVDWMEQVTDEQYRR